MNNHNNKQGSSLILSFNSIRNRLIIIGHNRLAVNRLNLGLDSNTKIIILGNDIKDAHEYIQLKAKDKQVDYISVKNDDDILNNININDDYLTFVTITDSFLDNNNNNRSLSSIERIVGKCKRYNIPVNVADNSICCDYAFPTTHNFNHSNKNDEGRSPLQIAVTTNSKGCRLASRIKRHIVSTLPSRIGDAVYNIGQLRSRAKSLANNSQLPKPLCVSEELAEFSNINEAVPQLKRDEENDTDKALRRMRWVAQISEYWPLDYLANMDSNTIDSILETYGGPHQVSSPIDKNKNELMNTNIPIPVDHHSLTNSNKRGHIVLVGAGLGSPELLTIAAFRALKTADLVLSDKLVPSPVLDIIPKNVEIRIARKFPGNAEGAQAELMNWAIEGAQSGKVVVRLKQGDPFVYGRGGEEVIHFRTNGYEPVVVPGISSAMSGPLMAGIPVTQRGASDSYLLCTGVGRGGKKLSVPSYVRSRTLVILMGVARLSELVENLNSLGYPPSIPVAIIEQASSPSQRVVMSCMKDIVEAYTSAGEQRPPGMIVVGWTILSLHGSGDMNVLDDNGEQNDDQRISNWLKDKQWIINEGCGNAWEDWLKDISRPVVI